MKRMYCEWTRVIFAAGLAIAQVAGCVASPTFKKLESPAAKPVRAMKAHDLNAAIAPAALVLPDAQKINYDVRWLGMRIGTLSISYLGKGVLRDRPVYILEGVMQTNNVLSRIYPVRDRYVSYMDAEKLYTVRHEVYRRDGGYKKDAVTDFDNEKLSAHFANAVDKSEKDFDIPEYAHDPLTAFFHMTLAPLIEGDCVEYRVCNNERNYTLMVMVRSRLEVKIPGGDKTSREALFIEPVAYLTGGERVEKGSVKAYFTTVPRRTLLYAEIKGPVFTTVTISLAGIETRAKPPEVPRAEAAPGGVPAAGLSAPAAAAPEQSPAPN